MAVSLRAKFGGVFASGQASTTIDAATTEKLERSELRVFTYQKGGQGIDSAVSPSIKDVMDRLGKFPAMVLAHPVPYEVQVANYSTLALPEGPNEFDLQMQKEALESYARVRFKLIAVQNDIELFQTHQDSFENTHSAAILNEWADFVANQLNQLMRQASPRPQLCCLDQYYNIGVITGEHDLLRECLLPPQASPRAPWPF